jgi:hypothetical protein
MAPTSIETKATLTARDNTITPDADRFVLVRFWAENLVDSRRHLPVVGEMNLHTESPAASYEPRLLGSWPEQYRGGTVEPGVIRAGRVVFDLPAETANQVKFSIQPEQSEFSEPVRWLSE